MIDILIVSFIGGLIRSALGIRKYSLRRGRLVSLVSSGIIGAISGVAFSSVVSLSGNAALIAAGLAGYVGADVVEELYKIRLKRGGSLI